MSNPIKHLIQIVESNQYEIPESDIDITAEHIVKVPGGYELKSKKTGRNLGKYPTRAGAEKRERQVQYFKHANEDTAISMIDDDISDLQNFVRAAYKAELGFNPDWSQEEWHDREFLMHWLERLTTYQSDDDDDTDVSVSELHETASDLTPDELRSWGDRPVTFKSGGFEYKVRSYTNHGDRLYLNIDSDDGRKIEREYSYSQLQGEVKQSSKGQRLSISLKPLSEAEETHQEKRDRIKKLTPAITRKQSGDKDWKLKPEEVRSRIHDTDYQNRTAHDINQGSAEASLNELSKDTLDSYRKKRSADNRLDRQFADRARDIAANKRTDGDDQKAAKWEDEADWLDNRVKKGEKGVALAATKLGVTEGYDEFDDEFDDEEESNLHSGSYVRDREDPSGEVFVMRGDASERRVQIQDRNGSGWNISPSRLIAVDANDPAIARYFGKQGVTESDPSGVMHAAKHYNKSFLITAELAEGGRKTFRVRAQSERVAREKFEQHHNQARVISVKEEGMAEGWDKLTPQQKAHEYNLDAAQREMDRRHAEGEDMTGAKIDKKTYQIIKPKQRGVAEEASPMIKPANNRFDNKQEAFKYAKEHGGSVFRSQYIDPNTGVKNISFVVKKKR